MPGRKQLTLLPPQQQFLSIVVTETIRTDTACIGMPNADYLLAATRDCVIRQRVSGYVHTV